MRGRLLHAVATFALAIAAASAWASAAPADAPVATSGGATSVTSGQAILNGIALNATPGATWDFEYGTSPSYGSVTSPVTLGTGLFAVSRQVTGLTPGTLYHFRLVVIQAGIEAVGSDLTFRTPAAGDAVPPRIGRASLAGLVLGETGRRLEVSIRCSGQSGAKCAGILGVTLVRAAGRPSLFCGIGGVNLPSAARTQTITLAETPACAARLRAAGNHDVAGKLSALFQGGTPLQQTVTLRPLG